MSDFESRVAEVLRSESAAAPDAIGLADAARGRARARRRTRLGAVGVLASVLVVAAVSADAVDFSDDPEPPVPVTDDPTATSPKPFPDGRWETWRGITVRVPGDWGYGDLATWCADGGSETEFRVSRPGGVVPAIACTPGSSYGLTFQEIDMADTDEPFDWPVVAQTGDAWPPGTFVGAHGEDGVLVTVAGPDRDEVVAVLSTVGYFDPVDPNGCSVTDDGGPGTAGKGEVPVCRYDEQGRLLQTEKLTGGDAEAAVAAVRASPQDDDGRTCQNGPTEYVVMGVEGDRVEVQYAGNSVCVDRGVFVEGIRHEMTADVLYWALSPGWTGAVDAGVPLPDPLRQ
ncbi:hypothetical protein [Nocardioides dilutus]